MRANKDITATIAGFINRLIESHIVCYCLICAHMQGYKQKRAYIAAQCPLKSTVADFWRMMNEFQCGCVVILCELEEEGQVTYICCAWNCCSYISPPLSLSLPFLPLFLPLSLLSSPPPPPPSFLLCPSPPLCL